jgi:hypothetical protein
LRCCNEGEEVARAASKKLLGSKRLHSQRIPEDPWNPRWVWGNTDRGIWDEHPFTSYFDVNYRGTRVLTHCHVSILMGFLG